MGLCLNQVVDPEPRRDPIGAPWIASDRNRHLRPPGTPAGNRLRKRSSSARWPLSRVASPIRCSDAASSSPRIEAYLVARSIVRVAGSPRSARTRRSTLIPSFRETSRRLSPIARRRFRRARRSGAGEASGLRRSPRAASLSRVATRQGWPGPVARAFIGASVHRRANTTSGEAGGRNRMGMLRGSAIRRPSVRAPRTTVAPRVLPFELERPQARKTAPPKARRACVLRRLSRIHDGRGRLAPPGRPHRAEPPRSARCSA